MEELARTQMAEGLYQVGKVHTSDNYGLVEKYDVQKLPRFILYQQLLSLSKSVGLT